MKEIIRQITEDLSVTKDEAELILASLLEKPRFELYMLDTINQEEWHQVLYRLMLLKKGTPLEYITKRTQFMDYSLRIYPGVFIPRFETEYFIELLGQVLDFAPERILDIGTGTGAISIALAHLFPEAEIFATDISDTAIECARENFETYGLTEKIHLIKCDIFPSIKQKFDLIVSNPPYIPSKRLSSLPKSVRDFEPMLALDGGPDGTQFIRAIMEKAFDMVTKNGIIALEIDEESTQILENYIKTHDYKEFTFKKDQYKKYRYLFIGKIKK